MEYFYIIPWSVTQQKGNLFAFVHNNTEIHLHFRGPSNLCDALLLELLRPDYDAYRNHCSSNLIKLKLIVGLSNASGQEVKAPSHFTQTSLWKRSNIGTKMVHRVSSDLS